MVFMVNLFTRRIDFDHMVELRVEIDHAVRPNATRPSAEESEAHVPLNATLMY